MNALPTKFGNERLRKAGAERLRAWVLQLSADLSLVQGSASQWRAVAEELKLERDQAREQLRVLAEQEKACVERRGVLEKSLAAEKEAHVTSIERINELEGEVGDWRQRHKAAAVDLAELRIVGEAAKKTELALRRRLGCARAVIFAHRELNQAVGVFEHSEEFDYADSLVTGVPE